MHFQFPFVHLLTVPSTVDILYIFPVVFIFLKKNHIIQNVVCTLEILKITTFRGIFKNTTFRGISLTVPPHNLHKNIHIYNVG